MGLFGRDDHPSRNPTPVQTTSAARPQPRTHAPRADGTTVIAPPSRVEGLLTSDQDIQIEGQLTGKVRAKGTVLIAESGKVEATVHGRVVVVAGSVTGDVLADEKIELQPSANLHGDITSPRILIQEGATFEGQVFMQKPGERKAAAKDASRPEPVPDKNGQKPAEHARGKKG